MEPEAGHCSSTSDYFCESTPGTLSKRKRKINHDTPEVFKSPIKGLDWSSLSPVPIFEPRGLLSSTHNESFTHNFENFTINSKGEDSVWLNNTIPTTPTKNILAGTSTLLGNASKLASSVKLGSPERNSILYPCLRSTRKQTYSPYKPCIFTTTSSAHKHSPAKKRLFNIHQGQQQQILTHADPVKYLNPDTMSTVYSYLEDNVLYTCTHVSKVWKRSVKRDKLASRRLTRWEIARALNKENWVSGNRQKDSMMEWKDDISVVEQGKILQYYSLSCTLSKDQSLLKCVNCQSVAIVTDSISQCQSGTCNYIACLKCGSFSNLGHHDFLDKCRQMKLELDTPEHDTSEKRRNTIYTFSSTTSIHSPSHLSSTSGYSSGYFTDLNGSSRSSNNISTSLSTHNSLTQRRMSEINQNVMQYMDSKRTVLTPSSVANVQSAVKPKLKLVPTRICVNKIPPSPPSPPSPSTRREKRGAGFKLNKKKSLRRLLLP